MTPRAIPAAKLKEPVFQAAANAAAETGQGEAFLSGYDETSGMFEFDVCRRDKTSQVVCVHLVLETFIGRPTSTA